jgi:hypothetical protein
MIETMKQFSRRNRFCHQAECRLHPRNLRLLEMVNTGRGGSAGLIRLRWRHSFSHDCARVSRRRLLKTVQQKGKL